MHDFMEAERQRVKQQTEANDRKKVAEAIISVGRQDKLDESEIVRL